MRHAPASPGPTSISFEVPAPSSRARASRCASHSSGRTVQRARSPMRTVPFHGDQRSLLRHQGRGPGYGPGFPAGPAGRPEDDRGAMTQTMNYRQMGTADRGQAHTLFAQTMGYVAITAGLFALGAWAGHNLTGGVGIVAFILAFIALFAMRFTARRSVPATVALLAAFGLLIGLAVAPTVAYYGSMDPRALWQAGGAGPRVVRPHPPRPGAAGPDQLLGPGGPDRGRRGADLHHHPRCRPGLLRARAGHFRRVRHVRLPATAHQYRPDRGPAAGGVDLPGRTERFLVLPGDLLRLGAMTQVAAAIRKPGLRVFSQAATNSVSSPAATSKC